MRLGFELEWWQWIGKGLNFRTMAKGGKFKLVITYLIWCNAERHEGDYQGFDGGCCGGHGTVKQGRKQGSLFVSHK